MTAIDTQLYRVNLICECQNDVAYGFGPDEPTARAIAEGIFRKQHGAKTQYTQILVEKAVVHDSLGGSHYETDRVFVRLEFTDGLGSWLDAKARNAIALGTHGFAGYWWDREIKFRGAHRWPYVFETADREHAKGVLALLREIARDRGNVKLKKAAHEKAEFLARLILVMP